MSERMDYYDVLGLPRDADDEMIRRAYHRLAKRYHPDLCKEAGAARRFQRICEAYQALIGPSRRRRYDRAVRGEPPMRPRGPGPSPKAGHADMPDDHAKAHAWGHWKPTRHWGYRTGSRRWEKRLTMVLFWLLAGMSVAYLFISPPPPPRLPPPPRMPVHPKNPPVRTPGREDSVTPPWNAERAMQRSVTYFHREARHVAGKAHAACQRVGDLDRGQGMGGKIDEVDAVSRRAAEQVLNGDCCAAGQSYELAIDSYRRAILLFDQAIRTCGEIRRCEAKRGRAREAKEAFRREMARRDVSVLHDFAPQAWPKVEEAHAGAGESWRAGDFKRARLGYVRARALLCALDTDREVSDQIDRASALFEAAACRAALEQVGQALRRRPANPKAMRLKKAILARLYVTVDCGPGAALKLVWIPRGTFLMGSLPSEPGRHAAEGPQHEVTISRGFHMGETEVTRGQWKAVMGTEPWKADPNVEHLGGLPATHVSRQDAASFCRKLADKLSGKVRLPTEAEWEYACRAGTRSRFSFGDNGQDLHRYGNYRDRWLDKRTGDPVRPFEKDDGFDAAAPVRSYEPNPWGLHDMHGNVSEWCGDWWDGRYYTRASRTDPTGPASGVCYVRRGGSWSSASLWDCRSAARTAPRIIQFSTSDAAGFRVVVEPRSAPRRPPASTRASVP